LADRILRHVEHSDDPEEQLRLAATRVKHQSPEEGWAALCGLGFLIIGIRVPEMDRPQLQIPNWFWSGARSGTAQVVILSDAFDRDKFGEEWRVDILPTNQSEKVQDLKPENLAQAMALATVPIERMDIEAAGNGQAPDWLDTVGSKTRNGYVLPLSVADALMSAMDDVARTKAHQLSFRLLDGPAARAKLTEPDAERLLGARLHHARSGGLQRETLAATETLLALYWDQMRLADFMQVAEQDFRILGELSQVWRIRTAAGAIQAGHPRDALAWLALIHEEELDNSEQVEFLMAKAEAEKSSGHPGARANSRALLQRALTIIETGHLESLAVRHDLARLAQYLEHDIEGAVKIYREIERELLARSDAKLARAILMRNLAEAYIALAAVPGSNASRQLDLAQDCIVTGRKALPPHSGHSVVGEIEYVDAKLAERKGRTKDDVLARFERCRDVALRTNHLMLSYIVEARLLWACLRGRDIDAGAFRPSEWRGLVTRLSVFKDHGWAARVLIIGHLRAAWYHAQKRESRPAMVQLENAGKLISATPDFDGRSDRERIGAYYAALSLVNDDQGSSAEFQTSHSWAREWLAGQPSTQPADVWSRII
jgi:hypothetical protein